MINKLFQQFLLQFNMAVIHFLVAAVALEFTRIIK